MTSRQIFEGMLTELSKTGAPSLLLQDFNYFLNKAITQYINKRYNVYDINLQTTDDLRVLKTTSTLPVSPVEGINLFGATYEVTLPDDYWHLLNCICIYELDKKHKCYDKGAIVPFAAKRLTSDSWSIIISDYYNRPTPERPYYFIHNVNNISLNPDLTPTNTNTDITQKFKVPPTGILISTEYKENFPRLINLSDLWKGTDKSLSNVEREAGQRYGNASKVRMEIRYGDDSVFKLKQVVVDYIKCPQHIRLTLELMNLIEDTSQIIEFPDYVCQEIINELTMLVMENIADPRLLTNTTVTRSIANPAQQLAQPIQAE